MEARLTIGDYSIHLADSIPASLPEYREHAGFVDEVNINGSEGDIFFLAVTVGGRWPRLVVAQRQEIVGDLPGVLVVPETNILFVGAGTRVTVYDLENPRLVWEDYAIGGFSLWERHGDVVLARKETPTSYHLAVTVDDALQGVTLVTRGEDLFGATHVHRLLQALLDLPVPLYHHHALLTDAQGRRLAKRNRAETIAALRGAGRRPEEVRAMAGFG